MNTHSRFLQIYGICLRLCPKDFRTAYGTQILLAAQDTLNDPAAGGPLRAGSRLILDVLRTAVVENSKHIGEHMTKAPKTTVKSSVRSAVLGAQIVGIAALSYFYLSGLLHSITDQRAQDTPAVTWYLYSILPWLVLTAMPLIVWAMLHKESKLSAWHKLTWSFGLGFCGALCFIGYGNVMDAVAPYYPRSTFASIGYDILVGGLFLTGFYLLARTLLQHSRLMAPRHQSK